MKRRSCEPDDPAKSLPLRPVAMPNLTSLAGILLVLVVSSLSLLPIPTGLDVSFPGALRDVKALTNDGWCDDEPVIQLGKETLMVNYQDVRLDELESRLRAILENRRAHCRFVYLAAVPGLRYGEVVRIIDTAKGAGATHVVILTDARQLQSIR
jgi:biopolymer transport protein ExbD